MKFKTKLVPIPTSNTVLLLSDTPHSFIVKYNRVVHDPHSSRPQNPTKAPGMKVSGFYILATITVSPNRKHAIEYGRGMNLLC